MYSYFPLLLPLLSPLPSLTVLPPHPVLLSLQTTLGKFSVVSQVSMSELSVAADSSGVPNTPHYLMARSRPTPTCPLFWLFSYLCTFFCLCCRACLQRKKGETRFTSPAGTQTEAPYSLAWLNQFPMGCLTRQHARRIHRCCRFCATHTGSKGFSSKP